MTPSLYVILQGALPDKFTAIVADCPMQIALFPLIAAVGRGLTVIAAVPLRSAGIAKHLLSFRVVRLYVLVELGVTANVKGLTLILTIETGAMPSVYVMFHGGLPVRFSVSVGD